MDLSILFNLKSYFLVNSKLITILVILLFNNASTVTSSCMLIISSPIFTITSLKSFSDFEIPTFIMWLASILNLL